MAEETLDLEPDIAESELRTITAEPEEQEERNVATPPRWSPLRRAILYIFLGIACALIYSHLRAKAIERQTKVVYAKR